MSDCRLYLITPPQIPDVAVFADLLEAVLQAGQGTAAEVACVQLRLKNRTDEEIVATARHLLPVCHKYEAVLILNDRPDLAKVSGADGVHLGQSDASYDAARALLGEDASIGITCHNSKHLALIAGEAGADYVAFGAFYPTQTKQTEHVADLDLLTWWTYATTLPCVAIGGITPENAVPVIAAGADFVAVSAGVWQYPQGPEAAIKAFAEIL